MSGLNERREQPDDVDRTGARNGLRRPEEIVTRFAEDGFEECRCAWCPGAGEMEEQQTLSGAAGRAGHQHGHSVT